MSELRFDVFRNNWVVIATDVELKPKDFPINRNNTNHAINSNFCPFCEGQEHYTPGELDAFRNPGTEINTPGWQVRAIPNKYSAFNLEGEFNQETSGLFSCANGLGHHEVVVETPQHGLEFHHFTYEQMELVYRMLVTRYNSIKNEERLKYIQVYKNRGLFAGASLGHSHSQIIGLPMVPDYQQAFPHFYKEHGECIMCRMLAEEEQHNVRIVGSTKHFLLICPYASRFSYETWIIPRRHTEHFGDLTEEELKNLTALSSRFFPKLVSCLQDSSYNIVFNTAPVNVDYQPGYHWYMQIMPRLIVVNGMELGSGYHINPVSPEIAARVLREECAVE